MRIPVLSLCEMHRLLQALTEEHSLGDTWRNVQPYRSGGWVSMEMGVLQQGREGQAPAQQEGQALGWVL